MKNLPLLMCTAFCGLNAVQADAADNKRMKGPIFFGLLLKIPALTNSVVMVIKAYTPQMRIV